ncbi:MAG: thioredoxin [Patescibacteria group bacterium]|nr:thioredoxin [Patescibacteria group bacterium]
MSQALNISQDNFESEVLKSDLPVLVDFWAPWCGPCQMMGPILDELAQDLVDKVKIVKVDISAEANQQLVEEYQIQSIPAMKLFKNGISIKEFVGLRQKDALKNDILNTL